MKRNIHNFIWDCIVFLPCLCGLCFLENKVKTVYLLSCLIIFLQMEVFFFFLQMKHCLWRDIGAVAWLVICRVVCPQTAVITGNRSFLWLVLITYLLIQVLRGKNRAPAVKKFGNALFYLTNFPICFNRYVTTLFLLILYTTVDENVWYVDYYRYQTWTGAYLLPVVMLSLVMILFKGTTHRKIRRMKNAEISACVMHASVYDCVECYTLPRILMLHMELTILTGHVAKQMWTGNNKIKDTYIGRYSVDLWEHAKDLPNKTCVLYWNSKKDRAWSSKKAGLLKAFIEELEQQGCNIAIVDLYGGKKVYGDADSMGAYLRKQYPYYYRNEMEQMILFVKREKEAYRNLLIQIMDVVEGLEAEKQKLLRPLTQQLTGNITSGVRCFYALMKICEFVIHTEALHLLETAETIPQSIEKPSMGTFAQLLDKEERITKEKHAEVIQSVRFIDCAMMSNGKSQIKASEVSYYIICEKLVNLRNRMIGHGTMVYSVSEELVENLARITLFLLQRYSERELILDRSMTIRIQENDVACICENHGHICFYNGIEPEGIILYLDYVTGNTIRCQLGKKMQNQSIEVSAFQKYVEETA